MSDRQGLRRKDVAKLVQEALKDLLEESGLEPDGGIDEQTGLIGSGGVLDSLGLVNLIVDLEQRLHEEHDYALILADERAMSMNHSPFRTVNTLIEYVWSRLEEASGSDLS